MIFKTKLLLSLGTLGVLGGTSTGVYYLKNKNNSEEQKENLKEILREEGAPLTGKDGNPTEEPPVPPAAVNDKNSVGSPDPEVKGPETPAAK